MATVAVDIVDRYELQRTVYTGCANKKQSPRTNSTSQEL